MEIIGLIIVGALFFIPILIFLFSGSKENDETEDIFMWYIIMDALNDNSNNNGDES